MKVALALVEDFEIVEAMTPIDILRRGKVEVHTISVFNTDYVKSSANVIVKADKKLEEVNLKEYDMLVLPGGPGTKNYYESKELLEAIEYFYSKEKKLGAICAAPSVFANVNVLHRRKATVFPTFKDVLEKGGVELVNSNVVIDSKIITGRSAAASLDFSLAILEVLAGYEVRQEVEKAIVY